jgi:virginiamycin A acetyltransferase
MAKSSRAFVTPFDHRVRRFLAKSRVFLAWPHRMDGVYAPDELISVHPHVEVEPYSTMPPRLFRSIGAHSVCLTDNWPSSARIGRHSFVAADVKVMGINHPVDWVTTHPLTFRPYAEKFAAHEFGKQIRLVKFREHSLPVTVGHGVNIGEGVLLKQGVTINTGAVVKAGAIVTRDVGAYEVVAGVPAKSAGLRFAPEVVQALLDLQWWNVPVADLAGLPLDDGAAFVAGLSERFDSGVARRDRPKPIRLAAALQAYLNPSLAGAADA